MLPPRARPRYATLRRGTRGNQREPSRASSTTCCCNGHNRTRPPFGGRSGAAPVAFKFESVEHQRLSWTLAMTSPAVPIFQANNDRTEQIFTVVATYERADCLPQCLVNERQLSIGGLEAHSKLHCLCLAIWLHTSALVMLNYQLLTTGS